MPGIPVRPGHLQSNSSVRASIGTCLLFTAAHLMDRTLRHRMVRLRSVHEPSDLGKLDNLLSKTNTIRLITPNRYDNKERTNCTHSELNGGRLVRHGG